MRLPRLCTAGAAIAAATALSASTGPGSAAAASAAGPPRAQLARFFCEPALDPADRAVSVRAVMRPLPGTTRFAVKFQLFQRVPAAAPAALRGGDLGAWVFPANPTLGQLPEDVWRLDKTVVNLGAPATYQFRVLFRWIGDRGQVLGSAVRSSRVCRQRELRPDLAVKSLSTSPVAGQPGEDLYTAVVANQGLTGAGPFEVLFVPGGSAPATTQNIPFLGAGRSRTLSFTAPACDSSDPPRVTADAAHQVDDYNRANNGATAVC